MPQLSHPNLNTTSKIKCVVCNICYHSKCYGSPPCSMVGTNWCCHDCIASNLPFANVTLSDSDYSDNTMNSNLASLANYNSNCLSLGDFSDECRAMLMDDGIDADLNLYNARSTYSSTYKEVTQLPEFFDNLKATNHFCISHLNCRAMNLKIPDIHLLLVQSNTSVLALTETWLTDDLASTISIPGFNFIHRSRMTGMGGGVGYFIRSGIEFELLEAEWTKSKMTTFESMFIKLPQHKNKDIIIGTIYRPSGHSITDFITDLDDTLSHLSRSTNRAFLAGDFNIDLLRHNVHPLTGDFLNTMFSHKFVPTILRPTRITETTATLIDNIFTNCLNLGQDSCILINDISDHLPVLLHIDLNPPSLTPLSSSAKRNFNTEAKSTFVNSLSSTDWSFVDNLCKTSGPNSAYSAFILTYKSLYDKAFPISCVKSKGHNLIKQPWMTKALLKSCKKKSSLYKKYLSNPTDANKRLFTQYRNKFKSIRNECESRYYADCFLQCGNNLNQTWKIIKQLLNAKDESCLPDSFLIGTDMVHDPGDIANSFNSFFTTIGTTLSANIPKTTTPYEQFMPTPPRCSFGLAPTSDMEVVHVTNLLKASASTGPDDINPSIAKLSITAIATPLTNIINSSFTTGLVPTELKIAKISPIYKSGEKNKLSNYRPISVLSFFSKIIEKLMANRVTDYLNKFKLLSSTQYGFQRGLSTYMALLDMQSNIVDSMDDNKFSLGIFFDLSKAFDTVNHNILANKLEYYGFRGISKFWFIDYLKNRTQYVYFKGKKSKAMSITCGVPQGSILGPLLFLLYINDLSMTSSILKFVLFADDTNVFLSHSSYDLLFKIANDELIVIADWFKINRLSLNLEKTNFILFHTKKKIPNENRPLLINDTPITQTSTSKFLGVIVDHHLTWKDHIITITNKIAKNIGVLHRIKHCLPKAVLLNLYYSLIFPYLSYCNISWGSNYPSRLKHLITLQKRAVRIVCGVHWKASSAPLFRTHKLLSLPNINKLQVCLFMHRFHLNLLPISFKNYFTTGSNLHDHYTRHSHSYRSEFAHLKIKQFSIKCLGPQLWNGLPDHLTLLQSIDLFKTLLKKFLLAN